MKRCKIQIIEDKDSRWISLLKDIDFKARIYRNINLFHKVGGIYSPQLNKDFFYKLFHCRHGSIMTSWDVIRNPTIEEMMELSCAAKEVGIKINLKTGNYIGNL